MPLEGTFLAWMDFNALEPDPYLLQKRMLTEANVWLDEGWVFGPEGNGFERIVLACPSAGSSLTHSSIDPGGSTLTAKRGLL